MSETGQETTQEAETRYLLAMHAMQSGVAFRMHNSRGGETEPKHLRVGVNSALVSCSTLVKMLCDKGVITEQEWWTALADAMEAERDSYQDWIRERFPHVEVTLG